MKGIHGFSGWLGTLDALQQENIQMKNILADIIRSTSKGSELEEAELFLNRFLNKDTVFSLLRYDIASFQKKPLTEGLQVKLTALEGDLNLLKKEFDRLKLDFNYFLVGKEV